MVFWRRPRESDVVTAYVRALNARARDAIGGLLHPQVRFVDSHGEWLEGSATVLTATERFFQTELGFQLFVHSTVIHQGEVLMSGRADAVHPALRTDVLWRARVAEGKLAFWQSYGPPTAPHLARLMSGGNESGFT